MSCLGPTPPPQSWKCFPGMGLCCAFVNSRGCMEKLQFWIKVVFKVNRIVGISSVKGCLEMQMLIPSSLSCLFRADNTWEPEENLDCPELISAFLESQKNVKEKPAPVKRKASTDEPETDAKKKDVVSSLIISCASPTRSLLTLYNLEIKYLMQCSSFFGYAQLFCRSHLQTEKPRGFARNLEPERIIGATDSSGELMFLMKWWVQHYSFCMCSN